MITPLGISEAYFKLLYNVGYALMAIIALVWAYQRIEVMKINYPLLFQNTLYLSLCFILLRL